MESVKKETDIKLILATDEERKKLPIIVDSLTNLLNCGWGGITIKVQTNSNGSKRIHLRVWEDIR
jgi:hypothetical protein